MKKFLIVSFSLVFILFGLVFGYCIFKNEPTITTSVLADYDEPNLWATSSIICVDTISFTGENVWTDGTNYYLSFNDLQCVWNIQTNTWTPKTWIGLTNFDGKNVWTDGTNYYYSDSVNSFVLVNGLWESITFNGYNGIYGTNIWTYNNNIYFSTGSTQYQLDTQTNTWTPKTWTGLTSFGGNNIFIIENVLHFGNGTTQYVYNNQADIWQTWTWNGRQNINGQSVWSDGSYYYYSTTTNQFVLDTQTNTWTPKTWTGLTNFGGNNIFIIDGSFYFSNIGGGNTSIQYQLDVTNSSWTSFVFYVDSFLDGQNVWYTTSYDIDIGYSYVYYYSNGTNQYVYDDNLNRFIPYTWTGLTSFDGRDIFIYSTYIYYMNGTSQYQLDTQTNTWTPKTWTLGSNVQLDYLVGRYVCRLSSTLYSIYNWSNMAYYDLIVDTYGEPTGWNYTSTFSPYMYGQYVWTNGTNYYYSDTNIGNYVFLTSNTWSPKTWTGLTSFDGSYIWNVVNINTLNVNTYYSNGSTQYVLDDTGSNWVQMNWSGLTSFDGNNIWSMNNVYYYSDGYTIYELQQDYFPFVIYQDGTSLTWSLYENAIYYKIYRGGSYYDTVYGDNFVISQTGTYYVEAWSSDNILLQTSNTLVINTYRLATPVVTLNYSLISWDPIYQADYYYVLILRNNNYVIFDTITSTTYSLVISGDYKVVAHSNSFLIDDSLMSNTISFTGVWTPTGSVDNYSFATLIGTVIDVPIHYITSLFNFNMDFLGFNLLSFITSMFTLCVIIWLIRFILARK